MSLLALKPSREFARRTLVALLFALALSLLTAEEAGSAVGSDDYAILTGRVHRITAGRDGCVVEIGKSIEGRPIYAVIVTSDSSCVPVRERRRLLFMSGQHGDERTSVAAMLDLIDALLNSDSASCSSLLRNALVAVIPAVNPDGYAAFRRHNASGADLNRDWEDRREPETRCVAGFIDSFRPAVVADVHEWTEVAADKPNWIEVSGAGEREVLAVMQYMGRRVVHDAGVSGLDIGLVTDSKGADRRLAHRSLASTGLCTLLIETSPSYPEAVRRRIYTSFALSVISATGSAPRQMLGYDFCMGSSSAVMPLRPHHRMIVAASGTPVWLPALPVMACLLMTWVLGKKGNEEEWDMKARLHRRKRMGYEILRTDAPTGMKLTMLRRCRPRPAHRKPAVPRSVPASE